MRPSRRRQMVRSNTVRPQRSQLNPLGSEALTMPAEKSGALACEGGEFLWGGMGRASRFCRKRVPVPPGFIALCIARQALAHIAQLRTRGRDTE